MINREAVCAILCLLTRAAWEENLPAPLSRRMVRRLEANGALESLVLRETPGVEEQLLDRARVLLSRAKRVYGCMQAYEEQGYCILTPEDDRWPERLLGMGGDMPRFLFAKGNMEILEAQAAALAGSRSIQRETMRIAYRCGRMIAEEGLAMVCGGAQGVDAAAQKGLLDAGGSLILVPALPVSQLLRSGEYERAMQQGKLLILCDTLPDEPFSAPKALSRNHTIYALGEAAVVVAARVGVGGSWQGATDCMNQGWTDVFAVDEGLADMAGCRALLERGAKRLDLSLPLRAQMDTAGRTIQTDMLAGLIK